jgi:hypothetical protein
VGGICYFARRRQRPEICKEFKLTLTVEELQEKIKRVVEDIEKNSENIHFENFLEIID